MRQKGRQFEYEIIVVDNASTDGSGVMVETEYPDIKRISNKENVGFAAANNQGIKIAVGRYVLLLNPDTNVLGGAIDKMIDWCDKNPDVGCAGCRVYSRSCFVGPIAASSFPLKLGAQLSLIAPTELFFAIASVFKNCSSGVVFCGFGSSRGFETSAASPPTPGYPSEPTFRREFVRPVRTEGRLHLVSTSHSPIRRRIGNRKRSRDLLCTGK